MRDGKGAVGKADYLGDLEVLPIDEVSFTCKSSERKLLRPMVGRSTTAGSATTDAGGLHEPRSAFLCSKKRHHSSPHSARRAPLQIALFRPSCPMSPPSATAIWELITSGVMYTGPHRDPITTPSSSASGPVGEAPARDPLRLPPRTRRHQLSRNSMIEVSPAKQSRSTKSATGVPTPTPVQIREAFSEYPITLALMSGMHDIAALLSVTR